MDNLQLKKRRLRKPECLSAKPVDVFEELFNRTSPQNSGPPKAAEGSKPASRSMGLGNVRHFRSR